MTHEEYLSWKAEEKQPLFTPKMRKNLIMFASLALYMVLLEPLGFAIASVLFIFGTLLWLGVRKIPLLILVPVVTSAVLFYVFKYMLYIRLPLGLLKYVL